MDENIILALIGIVPTLATIVTALVQNRASSRHAAKQSIFQMILEDYMADLRKKTPTNYQNILNEYDTYHKNGGNSYVTEKVDEYKTWHAQWQAEHVDKKKKV